MRPRNGALYSLGTGPFLSESAVDVLSILPVNRDDLKSQQTSVYGFIPSPYRSPGDASPGRLLKERRRSRLGATWHVIVPETNPPKTVKLCAEVGPDLGETEKAFERTSCNSWWCFVSIPRTSFWSACIRSSLPSMARSSAGLHTPRSPSTWSCAFRSWAFLTVFVQISRLQCLRRDDSISKSQFGCMHTPAALAYARRSFRPLHLDVTPIQAGLRLPNESDPKDQRSRVHL